MQFSASILDREAPVDAGTIRIAFFIDRMQSAQLSRIVLEGV